MNNKTEDQRTIICMCEDITVEDVENAIDEGYVMLEELKRVLRCGMGPCQGRTCMRLIAGIVSRKTGKRMDEIVFPTVRPPIRPVPIGVFAAFDKQDR